VRVKACALNHLDLWVRCGIPACRSLPHIPGSDVSGEIADLARMSHRTRWPEIVLARRDLRQMPACVSGQDNTADNSHLGYLIDGGTRFVTGAPEVKLLPYQKI